MLECGVQGFRERATPVQRLVLTMWMSKIGKRFDNKHMMTAEKDGGNGRPAVLQAKKSIWMADLGMWSKDELGRGC